MATVLPTYSRTIDTEFTETWDKIRAQVMDNITKSTAVWAMLRMLGCFKKQRGGKFINRTVRYALPTAEAVAARGDTLPNGEPGETKTEAQWTWRTIAVGVQRTLADDQQNAGEFQIVDYVSERLGEAEEALRQKYEIRALAAEVTDETGKEIQGLNDIVPAYANRATGTFGKLQRSNPWWQNQYRQLTAPYSINLEMDMRRLYNDCSKNQESITAIVSDQTLFETYEDSAADKTQIVKGANTMLADLGFESFYWKGKPWVWSENMTAQNMLMLNTDYIDVVYDPMFFGRMGQWKPIPNSEDKIAHIVSFLNMVGDQPRRHGRLYA